MQRGWPEHGVGEALSRYLGLVGVVLRYRLGVEVEVGVHSCDVLRRAEAPAGNKEGTLYPRSRCERTSTSHGAGEASERAGGRAGGDALSLLLLGAVEPGARRPDEQLLREPELVREPAKVLTLLCLRHLCVSGDRQG